MLPSLLARDIQSGLKQFLISAFEPADAFNHGLISRFVENEAAWMKGPYLQIGLPFFAGAAGQKFFKAFDTEHLGHSHQERSWLRLASDCMAASTLVATGTGSGKTECFLYRTARRTGRGVTLSRAKRNAVWPVFEEYRGQLASRKLKEVDDAYREVAQMLQDDQKGVAPYSAIVIDETQDFGPQALRLLRAMLRRGRTICFSWVMDTSAFTAATRQR